ncbi:MAG: 2-oxoglutarate and iron-dependent oxygenase domain-containing protein [Actinomycetota bacterium]
MSTAEHPTWGTTENQAPTLRARNQSRLVAQAEAAASAPAFQRIPTVDLSAMADGSRDAREQVAADMRAACLEVGFFYVTGHGVDAAIVEAAFATIERFFALPDDEKAAVSILNSDKLRGYTGLLEENTDPDNAGDLHEAFDIGLELDEDDPDADGDTYGWGRNQWPDLDGFRADVLAYYDAMRSLCDRLYRGFALSLDLPEDFFTSKMQKPIGELRLLRYPGQPAPQDDVLGIGAHSDYDVFTVLATDEHEALEILNPAGEWVRVPPRAGTFIINVGDLLERWTNDLYRSTVHRAINIGTHDRHSIPFFSNIDPLETVAVLDSCQSDERPARYPPVQAGAYVEACMQEAYGVE